MTKTNNTKKVATINTSSVKVQFMTSIKDFTATMAKFWVAINEMADKKLILQNNIRISEEWAELKKDDAQAQAMYLADVERYQAEYDEFKKDYDERIKLNDAPFLAGHSTEPEENKNQQASTYGKRFGNGGGVTAAVLKSLEEKNIDTTSIRVEKCAGADECKKALLLLRAGKLSADFVEGMMCEGGCVGGPSRHADEVKFRKDRDKLIAEADSRGVRENIADCDLGTFGMHKE